MLTMHVTTDMHSSLHWRHVCFDMISTLLALHDMLVFQHALIKALRQVESLHVLTYLLENGLNAYRSVHRVPVMLLRAESWCCAEQHHAVQQG